MVSKELLSEVLDISLQNIRYSNATNFYEVFREDLFNWSNGGYGRWSNLEVNTYELAHKCKEWAKVQQYPIGSLVGSQCNIASFPESISGACFYADTEPEAIFKACQWVLDNKE